MNRAILKPAFLTSALLFGILLSTFWDYINTQPYYHFSEADIVVGLLIEAILLVAIFVVGKLIRLFSRQINRGTYWQSWILFNFIMVCKLYSNWQELKRNPESFGGLDVIFIIPVAIFVAVIYAIFRSQSLARKGK